MDCSLSWLSTEIVIERGNIHDEHSNDTDLSLANSLQSTTPPDQPLSLPERPVVQSEVRGMLQFLRDNDRGRDPPSAFVVTGTTPLPLSADTFGWLQQDSIEEDDSYQMQIPYPEQDDPPDIHVDQLP